ncbi:hypothetical protein Tco_1177812, partial [Tanacetum coccineum]
GEEKEVFDRLHQSGGRNVYLSHLHFFLSYLQVCFYLMEMNYMLSTSGWLACEKLFSLMWLAFSSAFSTSPILYFYCSTSTSTSSSMKLHHSFRICLQYGCWFGGKMIQKLRQKEVDEESCVKTCKFIGSHKPVSSIVVDINESLRVLIWSVWVPFPDVGFGSLWLGDVDLLLVTFNSELKIFDSLMNNQASGEHS